MLKSHQEWVPLHAQRHPFFSLLNRRPGGHARKPLEPKQAEDLDQGLASRRPDALEFLIIVAFRSRKLLAVSGAILALGLSACGGGDTSTSDESQSIDREAASGGESEGSSPSKGSGPAREFISPGSPSNDIARLGREATVAEREAASEVLAKNLTARASGDWSGQCASLTAGLVKELEDEAKNSGLGRSCAKRLQELAQPLARTAQVRANNMTGPIDALRLKGDQGHALFHGKQGKDYYALMFKEDGEWKVASIETNEFS